MRSRGNRMALGVAGAAILVMMSYGAAGEEGFDLDERRGEHWAWRAIQDVTPPAVEDGDWPAGAIDRFLLARLEEAGLEPLPPADRRTLIRRIYFDLIGLPPTPEEVEAFVSDDRPGAYERVVDGLLASSGYGERWGRHWLDLMRYAETRGHEFDYPIPNAYQYRDYVIRAFNADVPYDRLVTEHIAGDLLDNPRLHPAEGFNESILGTGFWHLGEWVHSPVDIRQDETDRFDNAVDTMTRAFLGLTVACARCHDHKFDAISAADYYALFGFLQSSDYRQVRFDSMEHNRRIAQRLEELRASRGPAVLEAAGEARLPVMDRLAAYLLAAREAIRTGAESESESRERIGTIARARELKENVLGRWVEHLIGAADDEDDPLHAWALRSEAGDDSSKRLDALAQRWERRYKAATEAREGVRVLVDYAEIGPGAWMPDGVAWGDKPREPGDVRFGENASRPIERVHRRGAAWADPVWGVLRLAGGTEAMPGALGGRTLPGRTLRTPTFTVSTGNIYYLVRGSGFAHAVVDSHRMVEGPLHSELLTEWRGGEGEGWRWVAVDLSEYEGHRAHVEFSPVAADRLKEGESGELAVSRITEADREPAGVERPNRLLMRMLNGAQPGADEPYPAAALADAYQRLMADVSERLATGTIADSTDAEDYAALADWIVRHDDLFGLTNEPARRRIAQAVRPLAERRSSLIRQIQRESRTAPALLDGSGENEHLLTRGSHENPGDIIPRRFLEAIVGPGSPHDTTHGSGRLELARSMTDAAANPFLPRVMVNRVWHHLFGTGIVASVDNFGVLGQEPTHPRLLDHLAGRFVSDGWSVKRLIREIVLSRAYRMSSRPVPRGDKVDPENRLLHRMNVRRLEAEAIRDAILAVSGRLDRTMLGPPVEVHLTPFMEGRGRPAESGPLDGDGRRSIYTRVRRNFLPPMMLAFDTPVPFNPIGRRSVSNVPAQPLILMNDPFVVQQARVWAERLLAVPDRDPSQRITDLYQTAFARPPTETERDSALTFLDQQGEARNLTPDDRTNNPALWADLCHVLLNVKEFIFIQ